MEWKKVKTRSMVRCEAPGCRELIVRNHTNGAKYDEYYQTGKSSRKICPGCYEKMIQQQGVMK